MKFNKVLPLIAASIFVISSCGENSSSVTLSISNTSKTNAQLITPDKVEITETLGSIESKLITGQQFLPSTGDVNLLVVPVVIPGYETIDLNNDGNDDKEKVKNDIEILFNGTEKLRHESVSSFYKKSSFNKLNLNATVTDWYDISTDENLSITNGATIETTTTYEIVKSAINWTKNTLHMNLTKFDNDKDGYIDGVWLIYSANNYTNNGPQTDSNNFFAYTAWGNTELDENTEPNVNDPIYNLFGWASYDFMYRDGDFENIDSHTYVHEMGHFFGLNDYYTDNFSYNPIGKIDLMDGNVCDLNNYSKMLIGWTKPYIAQGNVDVNLKSMQNLNNFVIIPSDNTEIVDGKFDPFSEYILIEYYTNEGLNKYSSNTHVASMPLSPNGKGVRIYHIDNRKFVVNKADNYNITCEPYNGGKLTDDQVMILPITNDRNSNVYNTQFNLEVDVNLFDEIRLIEASNIDTFSSGGYQTLKSFFKENDVFSMNNYGENFFINNQFNNGDTFTYEVKIGDLK